MLTPCTDPADGTVLSSVFFGATAEYEIETNAGTLVVSTSSPEPTTTLAVGTHVRIDVDAGRSYVLSKP